MGLLDMEIEFNSKHKVYFPGSTVSGKVSIKLDAPKRFQELVLRAKGVAMVNWRLMRRTGRRRFRRNRPFTAQEQYFEKLITLDGAKTLDAGNHAYPFSFKLPLELETSFEGEFGFIRYSIKAVMIRPWKFNQECKAAFTVVSPYDLNDCDEAKRPLQLRTSRSIGACCLKKGLVKATVSSPFSGYASGQNVPLVITVINKSSKAVKDVQLALEKVVHYKALRPFSKLRTTRRAIVKRELGPVSAHASVTWETLFTLPPLPASNSTCSIIKIKYLLWLIATSRHNPCNPGFVENTTLIIGTKPVNKSIGLEPDCDPYAFYPRHTYEECVFGKAASIMEADDSEYAFGIGHWAPSYPVFKIARHRRGSASLNTLI